MWTLYESEKQASGEDWRDCWPICLPTQTNKKDVVTSYQQVSVIG